jgi:hypothetical protein
MIQRRRGLRFAAESFYHLRISGNLVRKELERQESAQTGVLSLVNHTHTAPPERL